MRNKKCGVYHIFCMANGKGYVGSSFDIHARFLYHKSQLRNNKHPNRHIQLAYNKHSGDSFIFYILANCPKEYRVKLEQWFKDKSIYDSRFNIREKCESNEGIPLSDSAKEKLRIKATNRRHSEATKKMLSKLKIDRINNDSIYRDKLMRNIVKNTVGVGNPNSKLSDKDVIEIKNRIRNGERVCEFKGLYNCSDSMIYEIKRGASWTHIVI